MYVTHPFESPIITVKTNIITIDAVRYILKWDRSNQCHYHPGLRQKINGINIYKCCNRSGPGCKFQAYHSYTSIDSRLLNQNTNLITAPPAFISLPKRRVVALDCEMVSVQGGATELALLCAIDVLTSEILIHKYIKPDKRITDYRTKWSGVTPAKMNEAVAKNQAYFGWKAARTALLSYIDNETILVGHALHHDLQVLNLIHTRCVDSGILAKNVSGGKRQWGLKGLSDQLLSRDIQNHGKKGHDCLEDTMATREVTIYCLLNREKFEMWGQGMRVIEEEKMRIAKEARDKKMRKKTEKNAAAAKQSDGFIERYNEMDLEEYVSDEYDEYDDLNHLV